MTKLIPKYDRILVRRESLKDKVSKIIIPESADKREAPARGEIVAMGPTVGYLDDDTREVVQDLKIGMRIIFGKRAGTEVEFEGDKYWLISDRDVLCEIAEE